MSQSSFEDVQDRNRQTKAPTTNLLTEKMITARLPKLSQTELGGKD